MNVKKIQQESSPTVSTKTNSSKSILLTKTSNTPVQVKKVSQPKTPNVTSVQPKEIIQIDAKKPLQDATNVQVQRRNSNTPIQVKRVSQTSSPQVQARVPIPKENVQIANVVASSFKETFAKRIVKAPPKRKDVSKQKSVQLEECPECDKKFKNLQVEWKNRDFYNRDTR